MGAESGDTKGPGVNTKAHLVGAVGMEGKVWMRDPGREMHWVAVSNALWPGERGKCPFWEATPAIRCPLRGSAAY